MSRDPSQTPGAPFRNVPRTSHHRQPRRTTNPPRPQLTAPRTRLRTSSRPPTTARPRTPCHGRPPMALLRHAARAARCTRQPIASSRTFSVSARRQGGGHGSESQFDPPTGWLWGIKPGEKAETEGWEWPMYLFCGSLLATGIALAFKPDTTYVPGDRDAFQAGRAIASPSIPRLVLVEWPPRLKAASQPRYSMLTRDSVSTWALEEARRRLEAEGILPDPSPEKKN
ncbi:hypothetical protein PCL_01365 [Purpureocillium lilacinum]|uniref:NADH-ubiquinone oxidoreductase ESSS subunit n=1 Tax=Purpureocillium lilacinum TaxID=33203 RepID=A0A2U3E3A3_PURLI|nr:hypothetical protein PCL_01365 [Purpureocillium lilacinum]